jgi:nuclear pore complex protein Nup85
VCWGAAKLTDSGVVTKVLDEIPIDSTIEDDVVMSNICFGPKGIAAALRTSQNIDTWLAAHLADVFDKLGMVPDDDDFDMSTRDYLLLAYADSITDSPSQWKLWRVIAEYLNTAADEGRSRLREYILRVALPWDSAPSTDKEGTTMDVEDDEDETEDRDMKHFFDLQNTCMSLNLHDEWREICTILASTFMRRREYGRAASLATQARDVEILSRIAEKIVETYIEHGPEEYLKQVNSLPANLLSEAPMLLEDDFDDEDGASPHALYAQRLIFLAEFRDYLLFMAEGTRDRAAIRILSLIDSPTTPVAFVAVLLAESVELLEDEEIHLGPTATFELMRILEDILGAARFAPHDYLHMLWEYLERTEPQSGKGKANGATKKESKAEQEESALRKLEVVRLALARNLSRAMVAGLEK